MINICYLFPIFFLRNIHLLVLPVSSAPDNVPLNTHLIDLNLREINAHYYDIIKAKDKSESYKLTPKNPYKIKSLILDQYVIWTKTDKSELLDFTVYDAPEKMSLFVFNTVNDGVSRYIHIMKYGSTFGYMGLFNFLYELNAVDINRDYRRVTLNVSDDFDKLYNIYIIYTREDLIQETFLRNPKEVFYEVIDNAETIWRSKNDGENEIGCIMVDAFKVRKYKFIKEEFENIHKTYLLYKLVRLRLEDTNVIHFKLDEGEDKWVEIDKEEFGKIYAKLGFNKMKLGSFSKLGSESDQSSSTNGIVDISKRSDDFEYFKYGMGEYNMIYLVQKNEKLVKEITYRKEFNIKIRFTKTNIVLAKDSLGWIYIELISKSGFDIKPIFYVTKFYKKTTWSVMTQEEFFSEIEYRLEQDYGSHNIKNIGFKGLKDGDPVDRLSEMMEKKIGLKNKILTETREPEVGEKEDKDEDAQEVKVKDKPKASDKPVRQIVDKDEIDSVEPKEDEREKQKQKEIEEKEDKDKKEKEEQLKQEEQVVEKPEQDEDNEEIEQEVKEREIEQLLKDDPSVGIISGESKEYKEDRTEAKTNGANNGNGNDRNNNKDKDKERYQIVGYKGLGMTNQQRGSIDGVIGRREELKPIRLNLSSKSDDLDENFVFTIPHEIDDQEQDKNIDKKKKKNDLQIVRRKPSIRGDQIEYKSRGEKERDDNEESESIVETGSEQFRESSDEYDGDEEEDASDDDIEKEKEKDLKEIESKGNKIGSKIKKKLEEKIEPAYKIISKFILVSRKKFKRLTGNTEQSKFKISEIRICILMAAIIFIIN